MNQPTAICAHCGDPFEPRRAHQQYCHPTCRMKAYEQRKEAEAARALDLVQRIDSRMGEGWIEQLAEALHQSQEPKQ